MATAKQIEVQTAWVLPPQPIRGLDHLGVQAPCIALYGQLLPGITNVTDRARYYSFHPWLVWSFEKRYQDRSKDAFIRVLRRAECLFALVGLYHARALGDEDEGRHGAGMVGREELRRAIDVILGGGSVDLGEYAALEGEKRYFLNKLGGLGQYYFGPLRDLKVLDYVDSNPRNTVGYDKDRGVALALAFDAGVNGDRFFATLEQHAIDTDALDGLVDFCPCGLASNHPERQELLDLFFVRSARYSTEADPQRRTSLALVLDLVARDWSSDLGLEEVFRAACYSAALPDGTPWDVAPGLRAAQHGWGTYQRNELLSVSAQGLFWAVLQVVDAQYGGRIQAAAEGGRISVDLIERALGPDALRRTVAEAVQTKAQELPALSVWSDQDHEVQRAWRLTQLVRSSSGSVDDIAAVAAEAVHILLSLLARAPETYPYADFDLDPAYFAPDDIHLLSMKYHGETTWPTWSMGAWVEWLGARWGIERHLRVALRKLRGESRDTFRIRPLDGELQLVEAPVPVFTSPRLTRAFQILRDLGLLDFGEAGWSVTPSGIAELEACRGS
ncbi:MAG: hypothetical protein QM820_32300 [Minicystis sp.]